jgi:chloramphenicol 3-O-phosphotransferase
MEWQGAAIFLLTGIPASGKSTVSDRLARRFARGVHVRGDLFRRMVVAGREAMEPNASEEAWSQLRLRYRLGAEVADRYFEAGFTVVVQDVISGPVLEDYVGLIQGRPLLVVVLAPQPEVVAAREATRRKIGYHNGWTVADFDAGFRTTTPRLGLWLDTSEQTPDQTVHEILARAWDEALI